MKTRQSAIDSTIYQLDGLSVYHFTTEMKLISVNTFTNEESAKNEFKRVTDSYRRPGRPHMRKRVCAMVYNNSLIIQL